MKRPGHEPPVNRRKTSWKDQPKDKSDFRMLNVNVSQSLLANIRDQDNSDYYSSFAGGRQVSDLMSIKGAACLMYCILPTIRHMTEKNAIILDFPHL